MYELFDKGTHWEIHTAHYGAYSGTFMHVMIFAIVKLGFSIKDLEEAVDVMVRENYSAAHFGINRTFMWPFDWEGKYERKAS
jgi:hypothetical protein